MLAKRIIPCLDVKNGRVVKGVNFVRLRDAGDPAAHARAYDAAGADELVLLDITASFERRDILLEAVRRVADQVFIPFAVGGGVRTLDDFRAILLAGADKVAVNTAAVENPKLITAAAEKFGSQCVVVAIDAKHVPTLSGDEGEGGGAVHTCPGGQCQGESPVLKSLSRAKAKEQYAKGRNRNSQCDAPNSGWQVYTHGGRRPTGRSVIEWAREAEARGAGEILLTSMDRDGTRDGYDIELTRAVADPLSIPVIASGGAGRVEHFAQVLIDGHADAVLAASLFHFGELTIGQVKDFLAANGIPVRRV